MAEGETTSPAGWLPHGEPGRSVWRAGVGGAGPDSVMIRITTHHTTMKNIQCYANEANDQTGSLGRKVNEQKISTSRGFMSEIVHKHCHEIISLLKIPQLLLHTLVTLALARQGLPRDTTGSITDPAIEH
jgi:hypothetical protein